MVSGITSSQFDKISDMKSFTSAVLTNTGKTDTRQLTKDDITAVLNATPIGMIRVIASKFGIESKDSILDLVKLTLDGAMLSMNMRDTNFFSYDDSKKIVSKLTKAIDDKYVISGEDDPLRGQLYDKLVVDNRIAQAKAQGFSELVDMLESGKQPERAKATESGLNLVEEK